ncbi:MAG TPA: hypothetical protein VGN05_10435 [Parvibaculum sp.]|jgi:hypothetical protein
MTILFVAAITIVLAAPANAAPIEKTHYDATMAALSDIQTLMLDTIDAIHKGVSPEEARTRLPHLQERLQWMRDVKVEAARADTAATLRQMNDENRRARCIVMRSGLMDERFQDILVDVTLKARGVADAELLPLERKPVEYFSLPSSCSR